ncbi:hypothetical protein FM036_12070 [Nostoc sp. HG1]|nr:hypothetical protein [Nostoc sp. HG1]
MSDRQKKQSEPKQDIIREFIRSIKTILEPHNVSTDPIAYMLEEKKKTTKTVAIAVNKNNDQADQSVKTTRVKNFDKYADIAPKSKEELKPIREGTQMYMIITLLMKGSTLDEFENKEMNIGTGRKGSRTFFGNYLKSEKGYGIKRTVDPSDPTNINKYVFHLQLPEGVEQPTFVSADSVRMIGKGKKKTTQPIQPKLDELTQALAQRDGLEAQNKELNIKLEALMSMMTQLLPKTDNQ